MANIEKGEVFTITEDGREQEVKVIGVMTLNGTEYAAVSFVEDLKENTNKDLDVFFLKADDEGDLDTLSSEEEFQKVSAAFGQVLGGEKA
ncbi:DUF1292 domain-containing protein [Weizmannia acidilactici]|uniref:DUF1292 domain-containing protein n=1 Tax=Weizmannia acidilactici TaxID=2607726 RepID=UPI00124D0A3F|nr:DUF1292 domain-containing protein [Weizmannia acidilactici]GER73920.1 DUF1292 domain-containing protein [Weizmannia acidilactici]